MTYAGGRVEAQVTFGDILGHGILWILISVITLGIGAFFYPYSFSKFIINRTFIWDGEGKRSRLRCDLDAGSQLGHILVWILLTVITVGLAFPFYLYKVWHLALNHTSILPG